MVKRTGVVVGMNRDCTLEQVTEVAERLAKRFPTVTFAVVAGAESSVAFTFDDDGTEEIDFEQVVGVAGGEVR